MLGFIWPWSVLFEKVPLAQPAFVLDSMECLVIYLVPVYMASNLRDKDTKISMIHNSTGSLTSIASWDIKHTKRQDTCLLLLMRKVTDVVLEEGAYPTVLKSQSRYLSK